MLIQLRNYWSKADKDERSLKAMQQLLKNEAMKTGVLLGYEGLTTMICAQYAFLPNKKLQYFLDGKKILEEALLQAPDSLELHFMRLAVQRKTPSLLQYQQNMEADKAFVLAHLESEEDTHLRNFIKDYWVKEKV